MKVYVYADESGVFDNKPESSDYFVYGGIVVSADAKRTLEHRYLAVEQAIRDSDPSLADDPELKAAHMSPAQRRRLYRLLVSEPQCKPFVAAVRVRSVYERIFRDKRDKQRFLDYALKRGMRVPVEGLVRRGFCIDSMKVVVDEHSTATSGMHSLVESVDEEFRRGIYTSGFRGYKPPLFGDGFPAIPVCYLDSKRVPLIRAADITANYGWHVMNDSGPDSEAFERMRAYASFLSLP